MSTKALNRKNPEPGMYYGISFEDYVEVSAVNNSVLKILTDQSPAHAKWYMENGRPETPSLTFGSAVDCYLLEPQLFCKKYVTGPDCRRGTKEWKEFESTVPDGVEILKPEDMEKVIEIYNLVSQSEAIRVLHGGTSQVVLIWKDDPTGLICKARLDYLNEDIPMITDLKTTQSADPDRFARDVFKYKYFQQAAFYVDGYRQITNIKYDCLFAFFAVEKEKPYVHSAMELGPKSMEVGRMAYRQALNKYASCLKSGHWPPYLETIKIIEIPDWALVASGYTPYNETYRS